MEQKKKAGKGYPRWPTLACAFCQRRIKRYRDLISPLANAQEIPKGLWKEALAPTHSPPFIRAFRNALLECDL
jgi:hypothetical protein